ncbi:MAG: sporulation protein YunB [Bacillota bacterium]
MRYPLKRRFIFFQVPPYRKRWLRSITTLGIICLVLVIGFYVIDFRVRPSLRHLAEAKARLIATKAINEAIRSNISPGIQYQNLIKVQFNGEGKVSIIQPNTGEINRISSEATLAIQKRLEGLPREIISVPLGQVLGSKIMAGFGPDIPVKVAPMGLVESSISDRFDLAGINQVRHRIYVTVKAIIKMVVPLINQEIQVSTDIPLVEAVIMGEVPNVYVGNGAGVIIPGATKEK